MYTPPLPFDVDRKLRLKAEKLARRRYVARLSLLMVLSSAVAVPSLVALIVCLLPEDADELFSLILIGIFCVLCSLTVTLLAVRLKARETCWIREEYLKLQRQWFAAHGPDEEKWQAVNSWR
ncbi:MAG TPA: hypothetical protein IAB18_08305 [Candidatus Avisuccinivibrio pullicola]|nr:hypothetical protein [Candidatus Avisuccinivibrio pullicola]